MSACILNAAVLGVSRVGFMDEGRYSSEMILAWATRDMISKWVVV